MGKRVIPWVILVVLLSLGGAWALRTYCPGLWTQVDRKAAEVIGWNEAAREADPVGFVEYASNRLQEDLKAMQRMRRELAAEIGNVSEKIRQLTALEDPARTLAEQFRDKYQEALAANGFPVEVRGAMYSQDQVKAQVSLLLAEADRVPRLFGPSEPGAQRGGGPIRGPNSSDQPDGSSASGPGRPAGNPSGPEDGQSPGGFGRQG